MGVSLENADEDEKGKGEEKRLTFAELLLHIGGEHNALGRSERRREERHVMSSSSSVTVSRFYQKIQGDFYYY